VNIALILFIATLWLTVSFAAGILIGRAIALHAQPLDDAEQDGAEGAGWVSNVHHKEPSK
jgi:hypothetical protein